MSALPMPFQQLDSRPFSFYPPIRNVRLNQWILRRATWPEIVVVNCGSGEEVSIPRIFVGELSMAEDPVAILGLRRELEWAGGAVVPYGRAVIELPVRAGGARTRTGRPAPVVSIRIEPRPAKRTGRKIAVAMMLSSVVCLLAADFARQIQTQHRSAPRLWEQLTAEDDYASVVKKLGAPAMERVYAAADGRTYRALGYPDRRFTLVLTGPQDGASRYAGAVDGQGRAIDRRFAMLRSLPGF